MEDFRGKVSEVYTVGDCGNPGIIADAIADGWKSRECDITREHRQTSDSQDGYVVYKTK